MDFEGIPPQKNIETGESSGEIKTPADFRAKMRMLVKAGFFTAVASMAGDSVEAQNAKVYSDSTEYEQAQQAYNDSLGLHSKYRKIKADRHFGDFQLADQFAGYPDDADKKTIERGFFYDNSFNPPKKVVVVQDSHPTIKPDRLYDGYVHSIVAHYKKPTQKVFMDGTPEAEIIKKQQILKEAKLYKGKIDGEWGQKSEKAWQEYLKTQETKEVKAESPSVESVQEKIISEPEKEDYFMMLDGKKYNYKELVETYPKFLNDSVFEANFPGRKRPQE